ncbi:MAG: hypothetical protein EZS28_033435 [Streblomastix strix]|uniref:Uncharacterized protein n=1 Tax=Streblomastix strix TaxID=222440 RepID=A0A5J4UKM8_9EUKA|nr:MAG: hypothetical protein EZS28_033435 [Streblomastix strix]
MGIKPRAVFGHSFVELAGVYVSGAFQTPQKDADQDLHSDTFIEIESCTSLLVCITNTDDSIEKKGATKQVQSNELCLI